MKIASWNVNGIRAVLKRGFEEFVRTYDPDVICLQETKSSQASTFKPVLEDIQKKFSEYQQFWSHARKAGYSGTLVMTKIKPMHVSYGIGLEHHDQEGRVITVEFEDFYLVNVYVPNSQRTLDRLPYRTQEWDVDFLKYLKKLEKKKPVAFCGDLNVAHKEIDLTNPKGNEKNHGFTPEERAGFDSVLKAGFLDTFREFEKSGGHYTWWSQMNNCRARNIGWRIDYFCISPSLRKRLQSSVILKDVTGSDHCPVMITIK